MEIEEHLQIKDMFLDHSIIVGKFGLVSTVVPLLLMIQWIER